jgi:hypothetical protein
MIERHRLMHELEVLEARRIADLASDARKVRDLLLEKVADAALGEPKTARGEHNPASRLVLDSVLASKPEFVALRRAIIELPRDIREKLWVVLQIGRGDAAVLDWDAAIATAQALTGDEIADNLWSETDLHNCLHKGLYELRAAALPDNAGWTTPDAAIIFTATPGRREGEPS